MNLDEFVKNAVRTESRIDEVKTNVTELLELVYCFTMLGEMLDCYKKSIFYNKDTKYKEKYRQLLCELKDAVQALDYYNKENPSGDMQKELVTTLDNQTDIRLFHGMLGIMTESSEMAGILFDLLVNGKIDTVNLLEEMADGAGGTNSWYGAIIVDALKVDPHLPMINVINKLRARYPERYSDHLAENRNLDAERKELENGLENVIK